MFKHILVPTDGSRLSVKAIKRAVKLAKATGARLTGFYAAPDLSNRYYGDGHMLRVPSAKIQAELTREQALKCLSRVEIEAAVEKISCEVFFSVSDSPSLAIIEAAKKKKCDLIVMASHGRRGLSALVLGSETHKLLVHSKIPVLVCR